MTKDQWDEWGRDLTETWWWHMGWKSTVCMGDGVTAQELWSTWGECRRAMTKENDAHLSETAVTQRQ